MNGWRDDEPKNQALFREVNERIHQFAERLGSDGEQAFICECGNLRCTRAIELSRAEYEQVRSHANRFIVTPDHENPETESIIEQTDRYVTVEAYAGASSRNARETDPRSHRHTRTRRLQEQEPCALSADA